MIFSTLALYSSAVIAMPNLSETTGSVQGQIVLQCIGGVVPVKEGEKPRPHTYSWTVYAYTLSERKFGAKASANYYSQSYNSLQVINEFELHDFGVKYDLAGFPSVGSKDDIVTISQKLVKKGHSSTWDPSKQVGEMTIKYQNKLPVCNKESFRHSAMHAVTVGARLDVSLKK
jgi:hypothetical protein